MAEPSVTRRVPAPVTPFVDPLPVPPRHVITEPTRLTVRIEAAQHRFHRDLPPSRVWTFDGHLPGPTVEVNRGVPVEVLWQNRLEGTLPVVTTLAPAYEVGGVPVQCVPGRSGGAPDPAAAALVGFSVVHLHGAVIHASSDGWTENLARPGQSVLDRYPNDQRAAMLWYHDHVMGATRFSVFAGLAGLWIVRDDRERELDLPEGPPFELPLLLTDRNFDMGTDGHLTGDLLHKTDPEVMECFGPLTAVNGAIWPDVEVEPKTYRLRVLNGSNARTYRLVLTVDGRPDHERIVQIGTDAGLLLHPVSLPAHGLVLASAERADLLVDFSDLAVGTTLTWWNTAPAPFGGTSVDPSDAGTPDLDGLLPHPEVLRFRVVAGSRARRPVPRVLATDFERVTRGSLAGATVRAVALAEQETDDGRPPMVTQRELAAVDDTYGDHKVITVVDADGTQTRYRTAARRFEDAVTFFPTLHQVEVWRLITSPVTRIPSTSISMPSKFSSDNRPPSSFPPAASLRPRRRRPFASATRSTTASSTPSTTTSAA